MEKKGGDEDGDEGNKKTNFHCFWERERRDFQLLARKVAVKDLKWPTLSAGFLLWNYEPNSSVGGDGLGPKCVLHFNFKRKKIENMSWTFILLLV